jgi:hypothetical protein
MSNQGEFVYNPVPRSIDKGENRLATAQNFRPARLWLTVAAVCPAWTEFGRLTGAVPRTRAGRVLGVAAAVMLLAGLGAWTLSRSRIGGEPGETD